MAVSGVRPDGTWVPAFDGQRPPFEPGHKLSTRHGAYAEPTQAELSAVGAEIRTALVIAHRYPPEVAAEFERAFQFAIEQAEYAVAKWRNLKAGIECQEEKLAELGASTLAAYREDFEAGRALAGMRKHESALANRVARWLGELGLTPSALARVGRDSGIAKATRARAAQAALDQHIEQTYEAAA